MEDIAEEAGVTKPVLYQHFPSKRKLYLELIGAVSTDLIEAVSSSATAESTPRQRVLAGFRAYFGFVSASPGAFGLLFGTGARQSDEFADAIAAMEQTVASTVASFIEADLDDEHREVLGYAIVGLAEVTSRRWLMQKGSPGPEDAELLARRLADLVWAGLRGLPGSDARRS